MAKLVKFFITISSIFVGAVPVLYPVQSQVSKRAPELTAELTSELTPEQMKERSPVMHLDFNSPQVLEEWRVINDGVMGGRSSGALQFEKGYMIFQGAINTNGGGFSSIRTDIIPNLLNDAAGITLRVKSDGRAYKLTFRTDARYRGRLISFQKAMPQSKPNEWTVITVPLEDMRASLFGRNLTNVSFEKTEAQEFGIILADGQDGPFRLEIDWIKSVKTLP